ncbi:MAG: 4-hydroxybenzoate octaprenyltransferase [Beijerinckiaceae bacterium]
MTDAAGGPAPADAPSGNIVDRFAPPPLRPYLRMARIDRPIGWQLLLLPCWWSSALAAASLNQPPNFWHLLLFLIGAIAMRGAGSVWNDIVDRDLDGSVERTRNRPLPSGQISVTMAAAFAGLLCLVGLAVLLSFNWFAVGLGFLSLAPVAIYPFMKRITDYPQAVLGLAFAWGGLMGWACFAGSLSAAAVILYGAAIAWTIGYDTIYAIQDIEDDGIVGIRSTARRFGPRAPAFVGACYLAASVLTGAALILADVGIASWLGWLAFTGHLCWQVMRVDIRDGRLALALFRSNWHAGLLLFAGLLIDSLV